MRRLLRFLIQLVGSLLCFVLITIILVVLDGLNDVGANADAALVAAHGDYSSGGDPQLERVAKLYKDGEFQKVIVSAFNGGASFEEQAAMTRYLEGHGVPSSAIIEDSGAKDTGDMAHDVASIMKRQQLTSVMIVTDYYRMSRIKLALLHAGVSSIAKSHVGSAQVQDAWPIACEVVALYGYLGHTFLLPAAEKIKEEATTEADKAKVEAQKAKESVDKKLDTLPK